MEIKKTNVTHQTGTAYTFILRSTFIYCALKCKDSLIKLNNELTYTKTATSRNCKGNESIQWITYGEM